MYGSTDRYLFWDVHKNLDMFACEEERRMGQFILCRKAADIHRAIAENKIAGIAVLSGGKALVGKSNYQTLANLRTLYRAGLRAVQLTGNGRNRLADGCGQHRTQGRLTDYGVQVVKEPDRLGMIIDTAQLNDASCFDLLEQTNTPLPDSRTCSRELSDHPQNIGWHRMEAMARSGGVVALDFRTALVATDKETGSGFCTSQEILQYFVSYGWKGLLTFLVMSLIFLYAGYAFLLNGYTHHFPKGHQIYRYFCVRYTGGFYGTFLGYSFFSLTSSWGQTQVPPCANLMPSSPA